MQFNIEKLWERWLSEYLSEVQNRYKWNKLLKNIKPNILVHLKENNIPPMSWRRGRVIRTITGSDGLCRIVEVRTSNVETKRSIHNVCPFPTDESEEEILEIPTRISSSAKKNSMDIPAVNNDKILMIKNKKYENNNNNLRKNMCNKKNNKILLIKNNKFKYNNDDNNSNNLNKNINKNNKIKYKNILCTILTLLAIISPVRSLVKINNFKNEAGIFFDRVATVGLTKTSWSITVHINISEYTTAMNSLSDAMMSLSKLETKEAVFQSSSYQNLQTLYERIENRHDMIVASAPKRPKRSFLPFVGGVLHSLFGLMDEEHAEEVSKKLKASDAKDEYLLNIVRNLSSAQDMTMEVIRKQNKAVFKDITKLSGAIKVLEGEIHETKDEATRVAAIANILSSLDVLERIQNDLIGAIFNAKGNFLNGILPIRKFKKQIELIKANLNKNLRLPTEDPVELAKVARVFTRTTEDFVLFSIQLPLINHEIFDAYEIYQYPITHDGYSVKIHSKSRYFLIDKRKALYYILDDGNFEHCQKMRDLTLCHQVHPLFSTRSVNSCEVKLFLRAKQIPDSCEIEIKNLQNYWRQTYTPNTWIFSVYEHTPAEVTCQGKTQHIVLHGSGLLTMEADCHLEAADLHLWAYDTYTTNVHYVFPSMNITSFMPTITHLKLNSDVEVYKIPDIPKESTIFGFPILAEGHHLNHYKISLLIIIIIMVVIIALFWMLRRTCHISSTYLPATIALPRIA